MRRSPLRNMLCFKDRNIYLYWSEQKKIYKQLTKDGAIRLTYFWYLRSRDLMILWLN